MFVVCCTCLFLVVVVFLLLRYGVPQGSFPGPLCIFLFTFSNENSSKHFIKQNIMNSVCWWHTLHPTLTFNHILDDGLIINNRISSVVQPCFIQNRKNRTFFFFFLFTKYLKTVIHACISSLFNYWSALLHFALEYRAVLEEVLPSVFVLPLVSWILWNVLFYLFRKAHYK